MIWIKHGLFWRCVCFEFLCLTISLWFEQAIGTKRQQCSFTKWRWECSSQILWRISRAPREKRPEWWWLGMGTKYEVCVLQIMFDSSLMVHIIEIVTIPVLFVFVGVPLQPPLPALIGIAGVLEVATQEKYVKPVAASKSGAAGRSPHQASLHPQKELRKVYWLILLKRRTMEVIIGKGTLRKIHGIF